MDRRAPCGRRQADAAARRDDDGFAAEPADFESGDFGPEPDSDDVEPDDFGPETDSDDFEPDEPSDDVDSGFAPGLDSDLLSGFPSEP